MTVFILFCIYRVDELMGEFTYTIFPYIYIYIQEMFASSCVYSFQSHFLINKFIIIVAERIKCSSSPAGATN